MGKPGVLLFFILSVLLVVFLLRFSAGKQERALSIALYPYVPDQDRFQQAVEAEWSKYHPEVKLNFVSWDSYREDPPEDLDVFVYDSLFFYDFLEKGYLLPIAEEDIREIDDFVPCALSACREDGITYALPQLLCTHLLYSRKGDNEISDIRNVYELYQIIGKSEHAVDSPPAGKGLLVDTPGQVSKVLWYLQVQTDMEQTFSEWVSIPEADNFDPDVMEVLLMLSEMTGGYRYEDFPQDTANYSYESLFVNGYGRAFIGYSESMYEMGDSADDVEFHSFSLSNNDDIPMLYADLASVNANIRDEKKALAVELLNIVTGKEVMVAASSPAQADQFPQYLLAARPGIYDELAEKYPVYADLKKIVSNPKSRIFSVRSGGRNMIEEAARAFNQPVPAK